MRRWLANVFRLGLKELAGLAGDGVLVGFLIYSFTFSIYSEATGVNTNVTNAAVAVVDGDHSALSEQIKDALLAPYFRPAAALDRSAVDAEMDRGRYAFVLDIPPRFEADLLRGRSPGLQLNVDATAMTQAGIGAGYIEKIAHSEIADFVSDGGAEMNEPVVMRERAYFNPNLESIRFESVVAVIQNVTILTIIVVGAAFIREREHGTIEHLLVMPVRASEIAFAKIWSNGLVILTGTAFSLIIVVERVLNAPIAGSLFLFLVGAALYVFATAALGILLATFARTMAQFALLAIPVMLVLNMLSGATSPLESAPALLRLPALALSPAVQFVSLSQAILYRGADFLIVWPQFLTLTILGGIFLVIALMRFRMMLAHQR